MWEHQEATADPDLIEVSASPTNSLKKPISLKALSTDNNSPKRTPPHPKKILRNSKNKLTFSSNSALALSLEVNLL